MSMRLKVGLGLAVLTLACGRGDGPEGGVEVIDSAAAQKTAVAALQAGSHHLQEVGRYH